jgi:hypothetical protein
MGASWVGFLAHLSQALSHCPITHAHLRRNLADAGAFGAKPQYFISVNNPTRTPQLLSGGPYIADTGTDPFADEVTLKLRNSSNDSKERLA